MPNKNQMHFMVPVALCEHAIKSKLIIPFKLYLILKFKGSKFQLTGELLKEIMEDLNVSTSKTIHNNLKILLELNWVGFNRGNSTYYVRGFDALLNYLTPSTLIGVEFYSSDLKDFRAFLGGALIGYLSRVQMWRERYKSKEEGVKELKNGSSAQLTNSPCFFPVSTNAISKILQLSPSTAHEFKKKAKRAKYISVKKNLALTNISAESVNQYYRAFPNHKGKLKIINNKVYLSQPDLIKPLMRFKHRKKSNYIKRG